ncbi:MAG: hypothetical protein K9M45_11460 [Kiritimatiellales bacterium]|nr:hypothetical protein [Kiritimatiellales bacterium]
MKMIYTFLALSLWGWNCFAQGSGNYPDPARFEKAIQQFEESDRQNPPPQGAILCIGSSSMRGWHETLKEDLAPLTVIPRGFGGSTMNDLLHFSDRVVLPYKPRAIVVYEGDNDVAKGVSPEKILETARLFIAKVHGELPKCRIYFLAIKPSIKRWEMWPTMKKANALIEAMCRQDERLTFVDITAPMLNGAGVPKPGIFKQDKLHMNRDGYILWRDVLKPILHMRERAIE